MKERDEGEGAEIDGLAFAGPGDVHDGAESQPDSPEKEDTGRAGHKKRKIPKAGISKRKAGEKGTQEKRIQKKGTQEKRI